MTDPSPKLRRRALEALSRGALAVVTSKLDLVVEDRRAQSAHVEAILKAKGPPFGDVLRLLSRDDLKAICDALGLNTSGKESVSPICGSFTTSATLSTVTRCGANCSTIL